MNEAGSSLPPSIYRPTFVEINTDHLRANFSTLRSLLPDGAFICPMIKANAYGHGDVKVAQALRAEGAEHFGIALIEEGEKLRQAGDRGSLLVFGDFDDRGATALLKAQLTAVASDWSQLRALEEAARLTAAQSPSRIKIHFKFNTGMNRLGFQIQDAAKLREWIDQHREFELEGICMHLLRGEDAGVPNGESESQFEAFAQAMAPFKGLHFHAHALNSGGLANLWNRVLNKANLGRGVGWPLGARPGISTYGIQPTNDSNIKLPLQPALSFRSRLIRLHRLKAGERVSYNATWRAQRESLIGVVPVGYADGYFRLLSNRGSVLCRGHRAPVAGTVCMDYFMIDLTDVEAATRAAGDIQVGEEIVLIGTQGNEEITANEIASSVGTISYEVLSRISERVPRLYVTNSGKGEFR